MKTLYLVLAIIGFALPNYLVFWESVETGNILLYVDPATTLESMFANRISSIFSIDLFIAVFIFFAWSYHEAKAHAVKGIGWIWLCTMLFGLAFGFPLFLFRREHNKKQSTENQSLD